MIPDDLVKQLSGLYLGHRYQEMLDLISEHLRELASAMTSEQITRIADLAHVAQMAVDLEAWDATNQQDTAAAPAARPA